MHDKIGDLAAVSSAVHIMTSISLKCKNLLLYNNKKIFYAKKLLYIINASSFNIFLYYYWIHLIYKPFTENEQYFFIKIVLNVVILINSELFNTSSFTVIIKPPKQQQLL